MSRPHMSFKPDFTPDVDPVLSLSLTPSQRAARYLHIDEVPDGGPTPFEALVLKEEAAARPEGGHGGARSAPADLEELWRAKPLEEVERELAKAVPTAISAERDPEDDALEIESRLMRKGYSGGKPASKCRTCRPFGQ